MSDYSPTSTPDPSIEVIAELERRDLRRRTGIGVLIAVPMTVAFVAFVVVEPDRWASLYLAAGMLGGFGVISWMRHCGSGHEHHRLRRQNKDLAARLDQANAAIAAGRIEQRQHAAAVSAAINQLARQMAAAERGRQYADAARTVQKINEHLEEESGEHRPAMGQAALRLVGSTPAHGIRTIPLPPSNEEGMLWPTAHGCMTG